MPDLTQFCQMPIKLIPLRALKPVMCVSCLSNHILVTIQNLDYLFVIEKYVCTYNYDVTSKWLFYHRQNYDFKIIYSYVCNMIPLRKHLYINNKSLTTTYSFNI